MLSTIQNFFFCRFAFYSSSSSLLFLIHTFIDIIRGFALRFLWIIVVTKPSVFFSFVASSSISLAVCYEQPILFVTPTILNEFFFFVSFSPLLMLVARVYRFHGEMCAKYVTHSKPSMTDDMISGNMKKFYTWNFLLKTIEEEQQQNHHISPNRPLWECWIIIHIQTMMEKLLRSHLRSNATFEQKKIPILSKWVNH